MYSDYRGVVEMITARDIELAIDSLYTHTLYVPKSRKSEFESLIPPHVKLVCIDDTIMFEKDKVYLVKNSDLGVL